MEYLLWCLVGEFHRWWGRISCFIMLEQVVIWPVRIAPTAPGRGLYRDSALLSLTIDPGVHGSPWSTRRSIGANCADCVPCNAWLTVATVYINGEFARL